MNDLSHCWSYTALVNSSCWLNIDIHTKKKKKEKKKRERQGYGCRRTQSHRGKTPLSLFFFITQMQIKDIHQVCDSPQQITNCQLNHQLAQLRVAVALLKTGCWLASWSVCVCVCVSVSSLCTIIDMEQSFVWGDLFSSNLVRFNQKPQVTDWETCACEIHENFSSEVKQPQQLWVISDMSTTNLVASVWELQGAYV